MIANSYPARYSGLVNKQNCGQTVLLRGPIMEKMQCKSCCFCVKKNPQSNYVIMKPSFLPKTDACLGDRFVKVFRCLMMLLTMLVGI